MELMNQTNPRVFAAVYWSVNLTLNFATNLDVYVPLDWTVDADVGRTVGNAMASLR